MTTEHAPRVVLVAGADARNGAEVCARLASVGYKVRRLRLRDAPILDAEDAFDAVVVNALAPAGGGGFLDLPDDVFVDALDRLLDVITLLQTVLPRLREGGGVVVLTSRGHLGGWGDASEMAVAGGLAALVRCVALEGRPGGVRANVVACDFAPGDLGADPRQPPDRAEQIAAAVTFLIGNDAAAINGEVLLANAGRSLQLREGRNRSLDPKPRRQE